MLDHGMRKYCNTMMRRAKVNFADKEDMQGRNPGGQEGSYERYEEQDFERFSEYQKAIPFLTISDDERVKLENEKLKEEKSELEQLRVEMKEHTNESTKKMQNDHNVITGLVKEMQEKCSGHIEVIEMINELRKEINEMKKIKSENKKDFRI